MARPMNSTIAPQARMGERHLEEGVNAVVDGVVTKERCEKGSVLQTKPNTINPTGVLHVVDTPRLKPSMSKALIRVNAVGQNCRHIAHAACNTTAVADRKSVV